MFLQLKESYFIKGFKGGFKKAAKIKIKPLPGYIFLAACLLITLSGIGYTPLFPSFLPLARFIIFGSYEWLKLRNRAGRIINLPGNAIVILI
jgi:hypothetical protein